MTYRLAQQQLQESRPGTEFETLPGVAAILLCSFAAALQSAIPAQLWTLFGGTIAAATASLYLAYTARAHSERYMDAIMEAHGSAPGNDSFEKTSTNALIETSRCNRGHAMVRGNGQHLTFQQEPTVQLTCFFAGAIVVAGLAIIAVGDQHFNISHTIGLSAVAKTAALIMGAALLALLINHLKQPMRRVVFDKIAGVFWIEHTLLFGLQQRKSAQMPIHQVVALQRLSHSPVTTHFSEMLFPVRQSSTTQELNVVFRNGERINVVCHNDGYYLKKDSVTLSSFLDVPVWVSKPVIESAPTG